MPATPLHSVARVSGPETVDFQALYAITALFKLFTIVFSPAKDAIRSCTELSAFLFLSDAVGILALLFAEDTDPSRSCGFLPIVGDDRGVSRQIGSSGFPVP